MENAFAGPRSPEQPDLTGKLHRRIGVLGHAAGAPGVGLVLSILLLGDAFAVGRACDWPGDDASLVGSLVSSPCRSRGCRLYVTSNPLVCTRQTDGTWTIAIPTAGDDFGPIERLYAQGSTQSGVALVEVKRPLRRSTGIWSPSIESRTGRRLQVTPIDPSLTARDEAAAAKAVLNAWGSLVAAGTVALADTALSQDEWDAMNAGGVSCHYSLRWGWVGNDAAVAGAIGLLFLGHPRRKARRAERRAAKFRRYFEICSGCGYTLHGLPVGVDGVRTCPECGKPAGGPG